MPPALRVVFDTNTLISALLAGRSIPSNAFGQVETAGVFLASQATLAELEEVLGRAKFDRVLSQKTRADFLRRYRQAVELVPIGTAIQACRDPRDDKFLDVCANGNARYLITGDDDLRALNPFQGIAILSPREFIDEIEAARQLRTVT